MRHIMVMNAKGGAGKSTVATNIAAYYAKEGKKVALADYDQQHSSLGWLARRPANRPTIAGIDAAKEGLKHLSRAMDVCVMDAPARTVGPELTSLVNHADTILIPVLPSPIDMDATSRFVDMLKATNRVQTKKTTVAVLANRVRDNTKVADELDEYMQKLKVPYVSWLREAQNYVRAYSRGLGIHELPEYLAWPDWQQWEQLIDYLESKRSQPS
ncbi:MAG: ParA family protein [Pseudomonadota bacterium]